jgi:hypothetical protein
VSTSFVGSFSVLNSPCVRAVDVNWGNSAGRAKCMRSLAMSLFGDEAAQHTSAVTNTIFDRAFLKYCEQLGQSPTALHREWKTGQSVLQALNNLQGQDEDTVFQGIQTKKGFELYHAITIELSKDNSRKVSAASVATRWNEIVNKKLDAPNLTAAAKSRLKQEYGFISAKEAQRHEDKLGVRSFQATHASTIAAQLMEIATRIKQHRAHVPQREGRVARPSSLAPGLRLQLNLVATTHSHMT